MRTPEEVYSQYRKLPEQDMWDYSPMLREIAQGNILEIGTRDGVSTAAFLLGVQKNGGHVYSVDLNPACGQLFDDPNWTFIHAHSVNEASKVIVPPIDILLIDGDHSYNTALSDLKTYSRLVRKGGLILMHDVEPCEYVAGARWFPHPETRNAFFEFKRQHPTWLWRIFPGLCGMGLIVKGDQQ